MSIKYGIVGLGGIASRFARVLNKAENVELVAVAARDKGKAEAFADKYHAKKSYGSYTELIDDEEVDAVYVALTHNFHCDIVKYCLNKGKAVLCEKPLTTAKKDTEELIALSRKKNVLLMEAMWMKCIPAYRKAREWVRAGKIGKVKLISASFGNNADFNPDSRLFNPKLAGGSVYDVGVYPIHFATGILNEKPEAVDGLATICETGVDEFAVINMSFKSGALASLSCGLTAYTNRDARIFGTIGNIVVYDFFGSQKCELYDSENNLKECFGEKVEDGFIYEIEHFNELYLSKKTESELIPHSDSIICAEIVDGLMKKWGSDNQEGCYIYN
ncbi:putative dehydrogenase [Ruminiclostridium sufflavum DSM 19573]|uniref:Putative dehydrogenase n=1 Tax=Ruminiclostridium sufflavum DSM 19573 TaxID=1121337 RepID=A0A318Y3F2_9FIRM|nr:Gfo/Idh/MocA family oxidoreductase [Ruminiclostridium sufflavum]PYG89947.1 putative dehydrogenase [Ruminiclostridium sufflavum DSM 19573]